MGHHHGYPFKEKSTNIKLFAQNTLIIIHCTFSLKVTKYKT